MIVVVEQLRKGHNIFTGTPHVHHRNQHGHGTRIHGPEGRG
jgi:hypothetical protein